MTYFRFVAAHKSILAFGFCLSFLSSFGQTFFIALFSGEIRERFGLTHGTFGGLYSLATLASGFCLIWVGAWIDRVPLRRFTRVVVLGLVLGCCLFATSSSLIHLGIAIFLLRLFGQGLMGHTSMTTMSRFFSTTRGKAMSVAALGFPLGEALFPRLFVWVKEAVGWRGSWWIIGIALAVILVPFVEWLVRKARPVEETNSEVVEAGTDRMLPPVPVRNWTRSEVIRDPRFHLVLPAILAPPFIATGVFFHQIHLVESKGWTLEIFTASFAAYAATQLGSSLLSGPLVDRFRASRLLPYYLFPLALAMALLAIGTHPGFAGAFMLAAGVSGGAQGTIAGAYWAETYGVAHLGAIRSLVLALMVFSTAVAPVMLGWMIDRGVTMERIAIGCLVYTLVASVSTFVATGTRMEQRVAV